MSYAIAIGANVRKSPFFDATVADGVTAFSVYNHMYMPSAFGDPEAEYARLLEGVVMWDVAGQRQVEIEGPDAARLVQYLTPRDLSDMTAGQGKYVPLCDHDGVLINDPVLLKLAEDRFWLSIADSDVRLWAKAISEERGLEAAVSEPDVSPLAVQGPRAVHVALDLFGPWVADLKSFRFRECELDGIPLVVARSGWSKQGGFELYLRDGARGGELWQRVKDAGRPYGIGPGAPNDVERLESGLLSYRTDADDRANPFEVGLGRFVDLDREDDFVGKAALRRIAAEGVKRRLAGLFLSGAKVAPNEHPYPLRLGAARVGTVSATAYSPRLERNIALALIDAAVESPAAGLSVDTGGEIRDASLADLPFC